MARWFNINITLGSWLIGKAAHPFEFVDENNKSTGLDIEQYSYVKNVEKYISPFEYALLVAYPGNYKNLPAFSKEHLQIEDCYNEADADAKAHSNNSPASDSTDTEADSNNSLDLNLQIIKTQIQHISPLRRNWWKILAHFKFLSAFLYFSIAQSLSDKDAPNRKLKTFGLGCAWSLYRIADLLQFIACLIFSPIPFFLSLVVKGSVAIFSGNFTAQRWKEIWEQSIGCFDPVHRKCEPVFNNIIENANTDRRWYLAAGFFVLTMMATIAFLDFVTIKVIMRGVEHRPFGTDFLDTIGGGYAELAWSNISIGMKFFIHFIVNKAFVPAVNFFGADLSYVSLETCKLVGRILFISFMSLSLGLGAYKTVTGKKTPQEQGSPLIPEKINTPQTSSWSTHPPPNQPEAQQSRSFWGCLFSYMKTSPATTAPNASQKNSV